MLYDNYSLLSSQETNNLFFLFKWNSIINFLFAIRDFAKQANYKTPILIIWECVITFDQYL